MDETLQADHLPNPQVQRKRPRWSMILILLAAWLVTLMPFLFWKATWFGTRLSDAQLANYLSDNKNPRHAQHALVQVSDRMSRGDRGVVQFYPQMVALADSPVVELRMTAAWVMGQDNNYEPFHRALLNLVNDQDPLVRWNAALALVRFKDDTGRPALHEILRPFTIYAPAAGIFKERLKPGDTVNRGTLMARITAATSDEPVEIRSPISGRITSQLVSSGRSLAAGTPVFILSPDEKQVWEALRALYLIGVPSDLPDVQPFTHPMVYMSDRIQQQAQLTVEAIQRRQTAN
ncbi:MAG: HEAT repeat domain-containing protein [Acidobacteriia bacterium]|nr:HEAT repeat domain-containing protein [Terriglobia bacterium]